MEFVLCRADIHDCRDSPPDSDDETPKPTSVDESGIRVLTALPSETLATGLLACLLLVGASGVAVATAADDPVTGPTTATQSDGNTLSCEDDGYVPPELDRDWNPEFVDSLGNDSVAEWTGGRTVRVGATGDCSLAVVDGETATLTTPTVDGTRGVLTGTLDLGSNGSLALVATDEAASERSGEDTTVDGNATASDTATVASTRTETETGTGTGTETEIGTATGAADTVSPGTDATDTASTVITGGTAVATPSITSERPDSNRSTARLVLSNDGPDFASSVVVESGDQSTRLDLQSGRFFDFAVRRDDGTVRVAVWDAAEPWDGQWDVRFENETGNTDWQVRLRGRAFLDGVALGVGETTATPGASEPGTQDGTPVQDDPDDEPFPPGDFDPEDPNDGRNTDGSDGQAFLGFFLVVIGAVGFRYARGITRFGEQLDAIGSTTPMSEVEAADWNVTLTKIGSAVVVLFGLGILVSAVL